MSNTETVTQLLLAWSDGDAAALDRLLPYVETELRRLASYHMKRESVGHTLQTTALVNELYLKLVDQRQAKWQNRAHFFAVAAQLMRRILVDHARTVNAEKRGGGMVRTTLEEAVEVCADRTVEFLVLDEALTRLARVSARQAQVIELRYFGGMNVEEMAGLLGVSPATISRDQRTAEAWLSHAMADAAENDGGM